MYSFEQLRPEIEHMLATVVVTRATEAEETAKRLNQHTDIFLKIQEKTGVPAIWTLPTWEREGPSLSAYLGNGDSLLHVTKDVPRQRGPFKTPDGKPDFVAGAIDSLHYDHIDAVPQPWTPARAVYEWEAWNGFGPRGHGRVSGYPWSGTKFYEPPDGKGGKYVADGQWSGSTVDAQIGTVPIMLALLSLNPALAFPGSVVPPVAPPEAPPPVPVSPVEDTAWLQGAFNRMVPDLASRAWFRGVVSSLPLQVDGNYGRRTRKVVATFQKNYGHGLAVDGIAGPATMQAVKDALKFLGLEP